MILQVRREAREQAGKPDLDAALEKQVGLRVCIIVCVYMLHIRYGAQPQRAAAGINSLILSI